MPGGKQSWPSSPSAMPMACPAVCPSKGDRVLLLGQFCPMVGRMCMDQLLGGCDGRTRCAPRRRGPPSWGAEGGNILQAEEPATRCGTITMSCSPGWAPGWSWFRPRISLFLFPSRAFPPGGPSGPPGAVFSTKVFPKSLQMPPFLFSLPSERRITMGTAALGRRMEQKEVPSLIEVKHLTKRYGDHTAVSDLTFSVEEGRSTAFSAPTERASPPP